VPSKIWLDPYGYRIVWSYRKHHSAGWWTFLLRSPKRYWTNAHRTRLPLKSSRLGLGQSSSDEEILNGLLRAYFQHGYLTLEKADALRSPPIDGVRIQSFDAVVSDRSAGVETWDPSLAYEAPFDRFRFGGMPIGKGDRLFIQHMLAGMRPEHGQAVAVVDLAALLQGVRKLESDGRSLRPICWMR